MSLAIAGFNRNRTDPSGAAKRARLSRIAGNPAGNPSETGARAVWNGKLVRGEELRSTAALHGCWIDVGDKKLTFKKTAAPLNPLEGGDIIASGSPNDDRLLIGPVDEEDRITIWSIKPPPHFPALFSELSAVKGPTPAMSVSPIDTRVPANATLESTLKGFASVSAVSSKRNADGRGKEGGEFVAVLGGDQHMFLTGCSSAGGSVMYVFPLAFRPAGASRALLANNIHPSVAGARPFPVFSQKIMYMILRLADKDGAEAFYNNNSDICDKLLGLLRRTGGWAPSQKKDCRALDSIEAILRGMHFPNMDAVLEPCKRLVHGTGLSNAPPGCLARFMA